MEPVSNPIPYRSETLQEQISRKTAFFLNEMLKKLLPFLANVIGKTLKYIFNLIPEALGKR